MYTKTILNKGYIYLQAIQYSDFKNFRFKTILLIKRLEY